MTMSSIRLAVAAPLLAISATALAAQMPFQTEPFTDVPTNHTYHEAIEYMRTQNVVRGYLDGTFRPQTRINRAEMAQLITHPLFLSPNTETECTGANSNEGIAMKPFRDVDVTAWYALPICVAKERMLVNGYPSGDYEPGSSINAAETMKIIVNTFVSDFKNDPTDEQWYAAYWKHLSDLKAIPASVKTADQIVTRGEVIQMIYKTKLAGGLNTTDQMEGDVR